MPERTYRQLHEQNDAGKDMTVLVRRSDKTIITAKLTDYRAEDGSPYVRFTDSTTGEEMYKPIGVNNLSDERQETYAKELGESVDRSEVFEDTVPNVLFEHERNYDREPEALGNVALKAAGINAPSFEAIEDVEFSPDQQKAVNRITSIIGDKEDPMNALAEALRSAGSDTASILNSMKTDQGLRDNVQAILKQRMARLLSEGGKFHERIQRNDPNNLKAAATRHGYEKEKYTSDEYVVLLAMAKLDGTFDTSEERDAVGELPSDHAHSGQHRQASDTLLESFAAKKSPASYERSETDNETLMAARKVVDELLQQSDVSARTDDATMEYIRDAVRQNFFDTNDIAYSTSDLARRLREIYGYLKDAKDKLRALSDTIEPHTLEDVRISHQIESAVANVTKASDMMSREYAYGITTIDSMTGQLPYDPNMMLQYRSQIPQIIERMQISQQTMLSSLRNIEI